jgi:RNA polymerase sigma-70 factor (ECF subfamily)
MPPDEPDAHLSQISTIWTDLLQAHGGAGAGALQAQSRLLARYGPAMFRYVLKATRDRDLADELYQEFALKLVRGDYRNADPGRGRFRDFLKTSLYHLIVDARRRLGRAPRPLAGEAPDVAESMEAADAHFASIWRDELIARTWAALEATERDGGPPVFTVLRLRTDHPDLRSAAMAERLSARFGRPVSAEWVRKWLARAREAFVDRMLDDVAESLVDPSPEGIEAELIDLGLLDQCRAGLDRRRDRGPHA